MWDALSSQAFFHQLPMMGKIFFAMVLGMLLGIEREVAGKPNGVRTCALVAGTSCMIILLGVEIIDYSDRFSSSNVSSDATRILHALIVGIGFIGGGMILKKEESETVENLTSAATVLTLAVLGAAVALNQYYLALFLTLLALFINKILAFAKKKWME